MYIFRTRLLLKKNDWRNKTIKYCVCLCKTSKERKEIYKYIIIPIVLKQYYYTIYTKYCKIDDKFTIVDDLAFKILIF